MPVTARLSRRFYDAIGDDAANDLVNWMNAVDVEYRTELMRVNEANFTRFTATLDTRFAAARQETDRRLDRIEARLDEMDFRASMARIDRMFTQLEARMQTQFAQLEARVQTQFAQFKARMLKWMLVFWTTTMAGAAATVIAVLQAR